MSLTMHTDWDDLLQQSESLATRNTQGFPRVERDISQIEAFSSRLRAKAQGVDSQQDDLAATRLLAQEGFNSRRLDRALQDVELKPTYEDLFQAEYSTVEEYLEQMHEMTVLSAIQDAQEESIAAFDRYMTQCIDQEWALNKRHLFESALADRGRSSALALPLNEPGNTLAAVTRPDSGLGMSESAQLSGREKGYTEVVQDLNKANLSRQKYDAVSAFAMVAAKDATDQHRSTIGRLWGLLSSLISEAPDHVSNGKTRQAAMLRGAQRYLEMGHVKHITIAIQSNRAQANLGGNPSKRSQIQAYLRMREKDAGPLDFDTPGGLDTTWHRIFFSLRSAYGQEALEVASKSREAPMVYGGTFARYLEEWISNDGSLSGESNAALVEECDRLRASADRATWQKASFRYKFAVHALLAGDKRCADSLLREGGSVFSTIEDFMWFMACLVRSASSISPTAGPSIRNSSGRVGDAYKLSDLQHYIVHFPPSHYSQNGKEPLLYATVLLLSLQFQAAITFLAKNATTSTYRVDAPHLAIALLHHQALDIGGEEDAGSKSGTEPGKLIHQYGLQFARNAYEIALEYFMLAAEALGNDKQTKARLLRELLTESNAFGFLLGSGSHGGALDRWMGNEQERQQLIEAVAYDCQRAAQLDWASELFLYANAPRPALNLLNLQISDLLEPGFQSDESELDKLLQRGADAANLLATSSAAADEVEKITFAQLKLVHQIFTAKAQANLTRAAQLLPDLNFLPLESFRLQRCTEAVPSLHRALLQRLPSLLLVGAEALAATGQGEDVCEYLALQVAQLRILVAFAGNLPQRISQGAFRELNDIYNRVS